jgi:hypothetical protein
MAGASIFYTLPIVWGATTAACGYLFVLAAIYRVGDTIHTRGGSVAKNEAPWTYRTNFVFMSLFGLGPAFIAIARRVVQYPPDRVSDYFAATAMIASGSLVALAMIWVLCAFVVALVSATLSLVRKTLR